MSEISSEIQTEIRNRFPDMSPGLWLFMVAGVYFFVGMFNIYFKWVQAELITATYCFILSMPIWIPPLGRWVGYYKRKENGKNEKS